MVACARFNGHAYEDPYRTGTLQEYFDQFDVLLNKVLHKVEANDEMVLSWFAEGGSKLHPNVASLTPA